MSSPDYTQPEALATLAHQGKRPKPEDCSCPPCAARRAVFGRNIGVVRQENVRRKWSLFKRLKEHGDGG